MISLFSAKGWNTLSKMMCVVSVLSMFLGIGFSVYRVIYLQKSESTQATITDLLERKNDNGDILYAPVYVFEDKNGNEIKVIPQLQVGHQ